MIPFNVSLNTEQFDLFREAIKAKYPGVGFQFIFEMKRIAFKALDGHTMPPDARRAAEDVLIELMPEVHDEVILVRPKSRKPVWEPVRRGNVRVEQRVGR